MKLALFGAGTMGRGIAQVFAAKGHTVLLYASSPASAQRHKDTLGKSLDKLVAREKMTVEAKDALLANILIPETNQDAADVDLVIECVKEEMATKKALLGELDGFIASLQQYRDAMAQDDLATLTALLDDGRRRKEEVDGR